LTGLAQAAPSRGPVDAVADKCSDRNTEMQKWHHCQNGTCCKEGQRVRPTTMTSVCGSGSFRWPTAIVLPPREVELPAPEGHVNGRIAGALVPLACDPVERLAVPLRPVTLDTVDRFPLL